MHCLSCISSQVLETSLYGVTQDARSCAVRCLPSTIKYPAPWERHAQSVDLNVETIIRSERRGFRNRCVPGETEPSCGREADDRLYRHEHGARGWGREWQGHLPGRSRSTVRRSEVFE